MRDFLEPDPLMSPADVSNMLQVKVGTVYKWIWEKKIPCVKIGRLVRIRRSDAQKMIQRKN